MHSLNKPALVIIDVQQAIDTYSSEERNNLDAEDKIGLLLNVWREKKLPVIHVRHSSKFESSPYHSSSTSFTFKSQVAPQKDELVITKHENCAFIGTDLQGILIDMEVKGLVVCGVLVNNSVDATVRVANGLGFDVRLVHDACASFPITTMKGKRFSADDVHWLFLSNLNDEYCQVCSTEDVLSAL